MLAADWQPARQIRTLNPSQGMQQAGVTLSLAGSWSTLMHLCLRGRQADAMLHRRLNGCAQVGLQARAATCALRVCQRVRQADVTLCQEDELDARGLALLAGQNP